MSDPLRERIEAIGTDPVPYWSPAPGDVLVGRIQRIDVRSTTHDPKVPVIEILDEETGEICAVWAMHYVLRSELVRARPKIGEKIAIKRLSDSEKGYRRYAVVVDRPTPSPFDWSRISPDEAGDVDPRDRAELLEPAPQRRTPVDAAHAFEPRPDAFRTRPVERQEPPPPHVDDDAFPFDEELPF